MNQHIRNIEITTKQISPTVLRSVLFTKGMKYAAGHKFEKRYTTDYEVEFILQSSGSVLVEEKEYILKAGDIVFRRPGQLTQGTMPYSCYAISIDLLGNTKKDPRTYNLRKDQEFQPNYVNAVIDTIPPVFHPYSGDKYQLLFESILKKSIHPCDGTDLILRSLTLEILFQMYSDASSVLSESISLSAHYLTIRKCIDFINHHFREKLTLEQLAKYANLSPNYLHRIFVETMKTTPTAFIIKTRMDNAKELLIRTTHSISDIAFQCGFENSSYFNYVFKKEMDATPSEFRKRYNYI